MCMPVHGRQSKRTVHVLLYQHPLYILETGSFMELRATPATRKPLALSATAHAALGLQECESMRGFLIDLGI